MNLEIILTKEKVKEEDSEEVEVKEEEDFNKMRDLKKLNMKNLNMKKLNNLLKKLMIKQYL